MTGHVTAEMQHHYSHIDLDEMRAAMRGVFALLQVTARARPGGECGARRSLDVRKHAPRTVIAAVTPRCDHACFHIGCCSPCVSKTLPCGRAIEACDLREPRRLVRLGGS